MAPLFQKRRGDPANRVIAGKDRIACAIFVSRQPERGNLRRSSGQVIARTKSVEKKAIEIVRVNPPGNSIEIVERKKRYDEIMFPRCPSGAFINRGDEGTVISQCPIEGKQGNMTPQLGFPWFCRSTRSLFTRRSQVLQFGHGLANGFLSP
jgi:hypothetical protein